MDINRIPFGLLSLLDIQNQGGYPADLQSTVQANIDLTQLYMAGKRQELIQVGGGITNVVGGLGNFVVVPDGEVWLIRLAGVQVQSLETVAIPGVAASLRASVTPAGITVPLVVTASATLLQAHTVNAMVSFDPFLLFPSGVTIAAYFDRFTPPVGIQGVVVTGSLLVTRISS